MSNNEIDQLKIIAENIESERSGLNLLGEECLGIVAELKGQKLRQITPDRTSKTLGAENLTPEPPVDVEKNDSEENGGDNSKENKDLEPILIPLVDSSILSSIKRYKGGGQAIYVNDRIFRFMVDKCGLSEGEAKGKKPEEALELISDQVDDDFGKYLKQVEEQTSNKLEGLGFKYCLNLDVLNGSNDEEDENNLGEITRKKIEDLLWKGANEGEREEIEQDFRGMEYAHLALNIRANGYEALNSYFSLNGVIGIKFIEERTLDSLVDTLSEALEADKGSEESKKFRDEPFDEEIDERSYENYIGDISKLVNDVAELSDESKNETIIDKFDKFADIEDFIEKIKLVAVRGSDPLMNAARKLYEAAARVAKKQEQDEAATPSIGVFVDGDNKTDEERLRALRNSGNGQADQAGDVEGNEKGLFECLKFWKRVKKKGKDAKAKDSANESDKAEDGDKDKKDEKQEKKSLSRGFIGSSVGNVVLVAAALGASFYAYDHIRGNKAGCNINDNTINSGASISNSFNCNNSGSVNNSTELGSFSQIKKSSDLNQQDAKDVLDRADGSYDGMITFKADANHNFDGSFKQVFEPLGASDDELLKLENYATRHRVSGQSEDVIQFNTYNKDQNFVADVLVLGARSSDTKLPDTTDVVGLERDDSIKLIGFMEAQRQDHQESSDIAVTDTTASAFIAPEPNKSPITKSEQMVAFKASDTLAVDLPTKLAQTSSQIKKLEREAVMASLGFGDRFAESKVTFMAPMFLAAGPIIEFGSGLKFLNNKKDKDDDGDEKEVKRRKKFESK